VHALHNCTTFYPHNTAAIKTYNQQNATRQYLKTSRNIVQLRALLDFVQNNKKGIFPKSSKALQAV